MVTQEPTTKKKARQRSPSYPAIDLETAIARAREIWNTEKQNSAATDVILGHWGYAKGSSNGLVLLAALLKYGLLADEGSGEKRKARLTDLARRIILDDRPNSPERDAAVREAALNPTIHKEFWTQYKGALPSDDNLRFELRANRHFTDSAVGSFLKELRSTWTYARLAEYVSMSGEEKDKTPSEREAEMTPTPATTMTGTDNESKGKQNVLASKAVKYCWQLSKSVMADVVITGPEISAKDIEMLRKYLELTKDALADQQ